MYRKVTVEGTEQSGTNISMISSGTSHPDRPPHDNWAILVIFLQYKFFSINCSGWYPCIYTSCFWNTTISNKICFHSAIVRFFSNQCFWFLTNGNNIQIYQAIDFICLLPYGGYGCLCPLHVWIADTILSIYSNMICWKCM